MTSNPEAGLLLTKSDLEKYSRKATSLKALVAKHSVSENMQTKKRFLKTCSERDIKK